MIDFGALKNVFNSSIDELLSTNGLVVPCLLRYSDMGKDTVCPNCIFDPISRLSGHKYNGTGPISFPTGSICPVCQGEGTIVGSAKTENINMAVIFDSKYFLNWSGAKTVDIPTGTIQSICSISEIGKIIKASSIVVDTNISTYGNYEYSRDGDPNPCGLGDHRYIATLWSKIS